MVTKPQTDLKALKAAKEAAEKAYADAIAASRAEAIKNINTIITDNALLVADIITNRDQALEVIKKSIEIYTIEPADVFPAAVGKKAQDKPKGKREVAPHAPSFKRNGEEIYWRGASSEIPADVQQILDMWKAKKLINGFINVEKKLQRLSLLVRIELAAGKGTAEQIKEIGLTRAEIDKATAVKLANDAAKKAAAKKAA